MFKRIMIAYDGSKEAGNALACAISLARSLDAAVIIVTVLEALPSYTVFASVVSPNLPQQLKDEKQKQSLALQKTALQIAIDHKVRATAVLVDGEEVAGIVEAARGTESRRSSGDWTSQTSRVCTIRDHSASGCKTQSLSTPCGELVS
jgi:nucleotide-binding universal stress UspA family protein